MKKIILQIMILLIVIMSIILDDKYYAKSLNYIDSIISCNNGHVLQCGINLSFNLPNKDKNFCNKWIKNMKFSKTVEINKKESNNISTISFKDKNMYGFIQNFNNQFVINIVKKTNNNDIEFLNKKVIASLKNIPPNINCYKYVKANIANKNKDEVNKSIMNNLKIKGATNINTVKINNGGYSIVANTGMFKTVKDNGNDIDLNIAICNYNSGNYILIGTPIIPVSY